MAMEFWFWIRVFRPGVGTSSALQFELSNFFGCICSVGSAVLDVFVCIPSCR
jgi:hypothetical protein